jgi:Flp pilus assembly protein TadG
MGKSARGSTYPDKMRFFMGYRNRKNTAGRRMPIPQNCLKTNRSRLLNLNFHWVYAPVDNFFGATVMWRKMGSLAKSVKARLQAFRKDQAGSMVQLAGYSMIPIFLAGGVAIDTARVNYTQQKFATSLDAAALAAAAEPAGKSTADLKILARKYVDQNFKDSDNLTITAFDLTTTTTKVIVTGTARVKTSFMLVANTENFTLTNARYVDISLSSEVVKDGGSVEVSLVLDNTSSMSAYMTDFKQAANDFIDTVVKPANGIYYSKVALIPYNRGVNVGTRASEARGAASSQYTFSNIWDDNPTTLNISTCVSERTGSQKYTDASVSSYPVGKVYVNNNTGGNPCISAEVKGLSDNKTDLKTVINSMVAGGSTAGQVGVAWGWYALSPNFGFFTGSSAPAAYGTNKLRKVMVLMTDAEYNSAYCNGVISGNATTKTTANYNPGSTNTLLDLARCLPTNDSTVVNPLLTGSDMPPGYTGNWNTVVSNQTKNSSVYQQSKALCTAMKAAGIEIYTIEFQLDSAIPRRLDLVSSCATDAAHRVTASDGASLKAAFNKIATTLGDMRVSK